jgi:hypothetical protein
METNLSSNWTTRKPSSRFTDEFSYLPAATLHP